MMKRNLWKRGLAGILAGTMLLGLAACGGDSTGDETAVQTSQTAETTQATGETAEEMGYLATVTELDVPMSWYNSAQIVGDRIYVQGAYYDEERMVSETVLAVLDSAGNVLDTITLNAENNRSLNNLVVGNDCLLATIYEWRTDEADSGDDETETPADDDWTTATVTESSAVSDDWMTADADDWAQGSGEAETGELPDEETAVEETEETDETEWVYEEEESTNGRSVYSLAKYSMEGELLAETEIVPNTDSQWFFLDSMYQDSDGNILLAVEGSSCAIYLYNSDLEQIGTIAMDSWVSNMFALPDGSVAVSYWGDSGRVVAAVDVANQTVGDPVAMPDNASNLYYFCTGMDGLLYGYNSDALYRVDLDAGEAEQIMYFLDWDINGSNFNQLVPLADGSFLTFGYDSSGSPEVTTVMAVPLSQIPVKTEISLGCVSMDYNLRERILDYNRKNDTYRIVVKDYSTYNTNDDYQAGYTQLNQDILNGNSPDILIMDELSTDKLIANGCLTDLYTLMSEDTLQKEDFIASYLACMEQNGGLYTIATNFSINTLVGAKEYVGDQTGWTISDFLAAVENLPEDGLVLDYETRDGFLSTMLYFTYDAFVDRETGTCSFDSQEFIDALNACMVFPEDYDAYEEYHLANGTSDGYSVDKDYYMARYEELRNGEMLLLAPDFWSIQDLCYGVLSCMTDDLVYVGYPGAGGNGAVINPYTEYAISAASQYQDEAWTFLCSVFTDDSTISYNGIPALQANFDEALEQAMEQSYYIDENGEKVYYDDGYQTPLTQDQVDWFRDLVYNAKSVYYYDDQLQTIVTEEAAAFFAGQKSAEDVAALIQNRVQTYLDEQR